MSIDAGRQDAGGPAVARRRRWPGCIITLLVIGLGAYGVYRYYPQLKNILAPAAPAAPDARQMKRSVPVVVTKARRGDYPIYLGAPGTVIALNTVTVRTRVDGQIMKVNYTEGQMVHEGDLLVQIDPRPFEVQLTQTKGQLAKDQASLKNAKLDVARYHAAGNAATQQQLDTAESAVAQFEGAVKTDQGQIDNANLQLTYARITAPVSGRIGLRLVDQGNMVHATDANGLAVITQIEPITVTFSLGEDYLPQVLKADTPDAKLAVDVFNRDRKVKLATGVLSAVDSQIDLVTLTAKLKATFDNTDHALFPNQAVNVRLLVDTKKDAVLITTVALQPSPKGTFVYVVKEDDKVEMRPVKPGPAETETTFVDEGLDAGETVVIEGTDKLAPGMTVTVPEKETGGKKGAREGASGPEGSGGHKRKPNAEGEAEGASAPEGSGWHKHKAGAEERTHDSANPEAASEGKQKPNAEDSPEGASAPEGSGGHRPNAEGDTEGASAPEESGWHKRKPSAEEKTEDNANPEATGERRHKPDAEGNAEGDTEGASAPEKSGWHKRKPNAEEKTEVNVNPEAATEGRQKPNAEDSPKGASAPEGSGVHKHKPNRPKGDES